MRCPLLLALAALLVARPAGAGPEDRLDRISLPPGFEISLYARVPGARALAVLPGSRTVVIGTRARTVFAVRDADGDGRGDETVAIAGRLNEPTGVAWHGGWLYVAEQQRVRRARFDEASLHLAGWQLVRGGLPGDPYHGTRDLAFGPDGRLYVSLGVPCNVCRPEPPQDAILRMRPDGSETEIFATGVRNSVGLAFHPATGELFFTDNGVDGMGDDLPPDELNRAARPGLFFGFPWFGGGHERTPQLVGEAPPGTPTFPAVELQPHGAALGIHFYRGRAFPAEYRHDAFVAQHGSSSREPLTGYRLLRVRFDEAGNPTGREVFAEGWLQPGGAWGRPVDVAELADGSLLVSDDQAGALYRIRYRGASAP